MSEVRAATIYDIPAIVGMGESFFDESGYGDVAVYSPANAAELIEAMVVDGTVLVCEEATGELIGSIGFVLSRIYMSHDTVVSQELFWFVKKEKRRGRAGILLLLGMEKVSKEKGANVIIMVCLKRLEELAGLYNKMGYSQIETSFMRVI